MKRKGFYIKKSKDGSIYINVFTSDFVQYLTDQGTDWVKLRIFERDKVDEKGHTHNMEVIQQKKAENQTNSTSD